MIQCSPGKHSGPSVYQDKLPSQVRRCRSGDIRATLLSEDDMYIYLYVRAGTMTRIGRRRRLQQWQRQRFQDSMHICDLICEIVCKLLFPVGRNACMYLYGATYEFMQICKLGMEDM
jgi:hypothetical protein